MPISTTQHTTNRKHTMTTTTTPSTLDDVRAAIAAVDALTFPTPAESPLTELAAAIRAAGTTKTRSGATWAPDERENFVSLSVDFNDREQPTTPTRWTLTVWGPMSTKAGETDKAARVEVYHYAGTTDEGTERTYAYCKADRYKPGRFEPMPEGARDAVAAHVLAIVRTVATTPAWWDAAANYAADRDHAHDLARLASEAARPLAELARKLAR